MCPLLAIICILLGEEREGVAGCLILLFIAKCCSNWCPSWYGVHVLPLSVFSAFS